MQSVDEIAHTLALAYQYRAGIDRLETELAKRVTAVPQPLQVYVSSLALKAVADHVAGEMVTPCPWDRDDPQPLRAALGELWWQYHNRYLTEYREG